MARKRHSYLKALLAAAILAGVPGLALGWTAFRRVQPAAITIGSATVYLRSGLDARADLHVRVHEAVHRRQFRRHGVVPFLAAYLFDSTQRLAWEAEASAASLCLARSAGRHELARLEASYAATLPSYLLFATLPPSVSAGYIQRAFRDGESCATLLRDLPEPTFAVHLSGWFVRLLERALGPINGIRARSIRPAVPPATTPAVPQS